MTRIRFTPRTPDGMPCPGNRYKRPCGQSSTYIHFCGPGIYYSCSECASNLRRAELDSELKAMGATIIQVEDLGAAMEAEYLGRRAGLLFDLPEHLHEHTSAAMGTAAAHLARLALEEVR